MAKYKLNSNILCGRGVQLQTGSDTDIKALNRAGLNKAQIDRLVDNGAITLLEEAKPEAPKKEPKAPKKEPKAAKATEPKAES